MRNELKAHFSINGQNLKAPESREEDASATFIARPAQSRWSDYEIIMWQQYPERLLPELQKLGITGGQFSGRSSTPPSAFVDRNMRWYAENIGTDFYAEYRIAAYTPVATPSRRIDVLSQLHANILDVFNEHGVQIMSPHYMADTAEPQVVPKERWYTPPAAKD